MRKKKANQDCHKVGSCDVSALGVTLFNDIINLHEIIGFSVETMETFKEVLTRSTQDDIAHEVKAIESPLLN